MDIWNELMARTGAKITFNWVPNAEYDQRVNITLASGDLPDVIYEANNATLLQEGAIVPLDDLLAKYGQNITRYYQPADYLYLRQLADGKIYHIPLLLDFPPARSMMVRMDWIKKLGVKVPETYADWKALWQAFKDNDMNGDGDKNNEIPLLVCELGEGLLNYVNFFGIKVTNIANNALFAFSPDETNIIGLYDHPDFRTYLAEMRDLYAKGLLDREFVTRDYKAVLDGGLAGSTYYFAERARVSTDIIRQGNPEGTLMGVPPIKAPNGKQLVTAREKMGVRGLVFTIAAEKKGITPQIMNFFDYMYSDAGNILLNYGIEGQHFDYVNGKPVLKEEISKGSFNEARKVGIIPSVICFNFLEDTYLQLLLAGQDPASLAEDNSSRMFYDALFLNTPYFYSLMPVFTTDAYIKHQASMKSKLFEIFSTCVTGQLSIDQFYNEYQTLLKAGWQEVIDAQNKAYQDLK
jgi:putative aldouronate transport system substrate-binding protein